MKILFLSVSAGAGHMKAAEALITYMEANCPGSKTMLVDALRYINPVIDKLVIGSYLNTLKRNPKIYGKLYDLAESTDELSEVSKSVNRILSYKIKRLIREFVPDIIVCIHPFTLQMVSNLKKQSSFKSKIVTILTDFISHPFWINDQVDAYIVAHSGMKFEMINKGVPEEIIHPLGIPVSEKFLTHYNKFKIRKALELSDIDTILIMGGSLGFGELKKTFTALLNSKKNLQLILVAGKNQKLIKQIQNILNKKENFSTLKNFSSSGNTSINLSSEKPIKIYGYTDEIPELMAASDIIISKPGGMTTSEALIKSLPLILISPIPGQEEKNARFLQNAGVAARIYPKQNAEEVLHQILDNPIRIQHMKEMAQYLARPNACKDIIELFKKLI